jgi:hypothetical protein
MLNGGMGLWTESDSVLNKGKICPCGICGGQSGTGTGFCQSTLVFPCQFDSIGAPLHGKMKTTDHQSLIFITGLHKKP